MTMKSIARWAVLGVLFLIPFIPLYVAGDMFFPFITSKGFLFRILIGIGVGAFVLLALADKKYRPQFSWTLVLYGALVVWMFIADFFAVNPHKAFWSNYERMDGWITMAHVFLFFVLAGTVLSVDKLWKRWWQVVLGASVLVSLHGLSQLFGLAEIHQGGTRLDANFGNAIYLAVYLMFTVGIAVWQAIESKGWLRHSLVALAVLQSVLIFYTATRGVILSLFIAAALVAIAWMTTAGKGARIAAGSTLILLAVVAGGFFLARDTAFVKSDPVLARLSSVFQSDQLNVRFALWGMAYEGFLERPIVGWGHEGYNYVFNTYYKPSLYAQEPWFDRAHSAYFDWLIAGGLPALLLFIALLATSLRALYRGGATRAERLVLSGIVVAYAIQAITAFDNLYSYILLAALFASAHGLGARSVPALMRAKEPGEGAVATVALPVSLVLTAAVVWMVNVPSMEAGKELIRAAGSSDAATALSHLEKAGALNSFASQEVAEQMITFISNIAGQQSVSPEVKQAAATAAFSAMQKEVEYAPSDARIHLLFAQGLRAAGIQDAYFTELEAARALSPKKQSILFQRGVDKWQMDDRIGAAEDFEAGYALDTSYDLGAAYAASGRLITGDIAGGKALLEEQFGTTVVDMDPLRFAYYEAKLYDELIGAAKLRVETTNGSPDARFLLAQAYTVVGRIADARAEIQATIAAHPESASTGTELLKQLGQ